MTPEKHLWSATIAQAVRDARGEGAASVQNLNLLSKSLGEKSF